jgi:hypothetical protein
MNALSAVWSRTMILLLYLKRQLRTLYGKSIGTPSGPSRPKWFGRAAHGKTKYHSTLWKDVGHEHLKGPYVKIRLAPTEIAGYIEPPNAPSVSALWHTMPAGPFHVAMNSTLDVWTGGSAHAQAIPPARCAVNHSTSLFISAALSLSGQPMVT